MITEHTQPVAFIKDDQGNLYLPIRINGETKYTTITLDGTTLNLRLDELSDTLETNIRNKTWTTITRKQFNDRKLQYAYDIGLLRDTYTTLIPLRQPTEIKDVNFTQIIIKFGYINGEFTIFDHTANNDNPETFKSLNAVLQKYTDTRFPLASKLHRQSDTPLQETQPPSITQIVEYATAEIIQHLRKQNINVEESAIEQVARITQRANEHERQKINKSAAQDYTAWQERQTTDTPKPMTNKDWVNFFTRVEANGYQNAYNAFKDRLPEKDDLTDWLAQDILHGLHQMNTCQSLTQNEFHLITMLSPQEFEEYGELRDITDRTESNIPSAASIQLVTDMLERKRKETTGPNTVPIVKDPSFIKNVQPVTQSNMDEQELHNREVNQSVRNFLEDLYNHGPKTLRSGYDNPHSYNPDLILHPNLQQALKANMNQKTRTATTGHELCVQLVNALKEQHAQGWNKEFTVDELLNIISMTPHMFKQHKEQR